MFSIEQVRIRVWERDKQNDARTLSMYKTHTYRQTVINDVMGSSLISSKHPITQMILSHEKS